ncbi:hypothetical protein SAY87_008219 [Trapa incisa]|uniref:Uncharacterized protein n=1 Tax=Trapa incisa TaxID=236973 RepID=A0AAN7QFU8_9MYRT|nr:hypothetical protein SAY87_008219 [Trapa incisa]
MVSDLQSYHMPNREHPDAVQLNRGMSFQVSSTSINTNCRCKYYMKGVKGGSDNSGVREKETRDQDTRKLSGDQGDTICVLGRETGMRLEEGKEGRRGGGRKEDT